MFVQFRLIVSLGILGNPDAAMHHPELFYLDLRTGTQLIEDEEGMSLPSLDAAIHEARRNAQSIMASDVLQGFLDLDQEIMIRSGAGIQLASLRFGDAVSFGLTNPFRN